MDKVSHSECFWVKLQIFFPLDITMSYNLKLTRGRLIRVGTKWLTFLNTEVAATILLKRGAQMALTAFEISVQAEVQFTAWVA